MTQAPSKGLYNAALHQFSPFLESARNDKDKFALAALRLRESKERKTAEKRERELQRTDKAPPPKRARWVVA
ncbi:hypothetical protein FRC04_008821 [Tulasnella sp. 424]|nr:hypothetical protein FRC04_008821 [Tulasnella sp. 424]